MTEDATVSVLARAVEWPEQLVLGSAGTTVAILAVAGVGIATLTGNMPVRRALSVVIGCFILFGAPVIAAGLLGSTAPRAALPVDVPAAPITAYTPSVPAVTPYDPYAGAAVPTRNTRLGSDTPFR